MKCFMRKRRWRQDEDKRVDKTWFFIKFYYIFPPFPKPAFLDIYWKKKNSAHSLLVHGHSSWSISGLHLVRGPKILVNWFFTKSDHEVVVEYFMLDHQVVVEFFMFVFIVSWLLASFSSRPLYKATKVQANCVTCILNWRLSWTFKSLY